jgi:hypothetical protein
MKELVKNKFQHLVHFSRTSIVTPRLAESSFLSPKREGGKKPGGKELHEG